MDVSGNRIGDHVAKALSYSLPYMNELYSLDISWNHISIIGGGELLKSMENLKNLKKLRIKGNSFKIQKKEEAKPFVLGGPNIEL